MSKPWKPGRPSHATVVAYLALFIALGGGAMAATHLGKNTVGAKQLKKNAVTTVKIKDGAVNAAKVQEHALTGAQVANGSLTGAQVANGSLTGAQVDASTLGIVPAAERANSLPPAEGWHMVGSPGEPEFQHNWKDFEASAAPEAVGFFKDHEGIVHLKGTATGGSPSQIVFALPPGFRPAAGKTIFPVVRCQCTTSSTDFLNIGGTSSEDFNSGAVYAPPATTVSFDGVTFRAES